MNLLGPHGLEETLDKHAVMRTSQTWMSRRLALINPLHHPVVDDLTRIQYIHQFLELFCGNLKQTITMCNGHEMRLYLEQHFEFVQVKHAQGGRRWSLRSRQELVTKEHAETWKHSLEKNLALAHHGGCCIADPIDAIIIDPKRTDPALVDADKKTKAMFFARYLYFRRCDGKYSNALREELLGRKSVSTRSATEKKDLVQEWWDTMYDLGSAKRQPVYISDGMVVTTVDKYKTSGKRWNEEEPGVVEDDIGVQQAISKSLRALQKSERKCRGRMHGVISSQMRTV